VNRIGFLRIEIMPAVYGRPGAYQARFDVAVGERRLDCVEYVYDEDELRSRFDQIFDFAREALRREMLKG
jgi:hypothetical protein